MSKARTTRFRSGLVLLALGAAGLAGVSPAALAQDAQQLETIEKQIGSSQAERDRIAAEIEATVREQEEVAERLVAVSSAIKAQEAAIAGSEAELNRLA